MPQKGELGLIPGRPLGREVVSDRDVSGCPGAGTQAPRRGEAPPFFSPFSLSRGSRLAFQVHLQCGPGGCSGIPGGEGRTP